MADFEVSKRHVEGELDEDGVHAIEFEHSELTFDFGDRVYRARIEVDFPREASITGPLRTADPDSQRDLAAIALYLVETEGIKRVLTLSDPSGRRPANRTGGFKPIDLAFFLKD